MREIFGGAFSAALAFAAIAAGIGGITTIFVSDPSIAEQFVQQCHFDLPLTMLFRRLGAPCV